MADNFFDANIVLQNDVVLLEPLQEHHYAPLLAIAIAQPNLWNFTSAKINKEIDFRRYFETALAERANHQSYPFAYFDKSTQQIVGCTRYANIDFKNKKLEIGWTWLTTPLHGSGFNKYCKHLLLNYGFETLQLNRIELKTNALNLISQKAMQNIGAVKEGLLRNHMIGDDGTVRDTIYFSFIKEEWPFINAQYF
jgi:N-acetyltransferase